MLSTQALVEPHKLAESLTGLGNSAARVVVRNLVVAVLDSHSFVAPGYMPDTLPGQPGQPDQPVGLGIRLLAALEVEHNFAGYPES